MSASGAIHHKVIQKYMHEYQYTLSESFYDDSLKCGWHSPARRAKSVTVPLVTRSRILGPLVSESRYCGYRGLESGLGFEVKRDIVN